MKLGVHVLDLSEKAPAIVILSTSAEGVIQLISFCTKMLKLAPDMPVGPIAPHLCFDVSQHPVQMINFVIKPAAFAAMIELVVAVVVTTTVARVALIDRLLTVTGLLSIDRLITALVLFMREGSIIETQECYRRQCNC